MAMDQAGRVLRVIVDFDTCESHANCMRAAPTVFEVRDDMCLYLLDETPGESLRAAVEEAARSCPTESIFIVDDA
ncbi:MAG TPA: ferredoxin [Acidimicrobiales bacterium]|nr:ferredoxin [Acidimicrobiales bacterium]